jgi:adenylosuccinate synthase
VDILPLDADEIARLRSPVYERFEGWSADHRRA